VRERAQSLLRVIAVRMLTLTMVWLALMIAFVQSEVERNARALRSQSLEATARMLARQLDTGAEVLAFAPPKTELPPDGCSHPATRWRRRSPCPRSRPRRRSWILTRRSPDNAMPARSRLRLWMDARPSRSR
jgi:hypothetical protein